MMRAKIVTELLAAIHQLGAAKDGSEWYIFGSVDRDESTANDIDLLILCVDANQANHFRRSIDPDSFALPLDLALMTFDEAVEIDVVRCQSGRMIFPRSDV